MPSRQAFLNAEQEGHHILALRQKIPELIEVRDQIWEKAKREGLIARSLDDGKTSFDTRTPEGQALAEEARRYEDELKAYKDRFAHLDREPTDYDRKQHEATLQAEQRDAVWREAERLGMMKEAEEGGNAYKHISTETS